MQHPAPREDFGERRSREESEGLLTFCYFPASNNAAIDEFSWSQNRARYCQIANSRPGAPDVERLMPVKSIDDQSPAFGPFIADIKNKNHMQLYCIVASLDGHLWPLLSFLNPRGEQNGKRGYCFPQRGLRSLLSRPGAKQMSNWLLKGFDATSPLSFPTSKGK
ncbi:hypothetical protein TNCV_1256791 [Trichonephila clavipes]|nr:hypothetical protein TNCV_1256791 [Trichonephila clavipes]